MTETILPPNKFQDEPVSQPLRDVDWEPEAKREPAVDHHAVIGELARELRNASPSGANTISDKILFHLGAIANPEEYQAKVEADQKAEDELEAQRKAEREALKSKPETEKV